jgi:hypothetical protein
LNQNPLLMVISTKIFFAPGAKIVFQQHRPKADIELTMARSTAASRRLLLRSVRLWRVAVHGLQLRSSTMSRIFISGSSTGLGLMAADLLVSKGHSVVLHARNAKRAEAVRQETEAIVVGDVETISGAKEVAAQVNALGHFDTVIHNAAVGYREGHRVTADGLPHVFAINTLSAYILTALIERPKRLVYLSSGMHHHADANLDDILWKKRRWSGSTAYAESKLHVQWRRPASHRLAVADHDRLGLGQFLADCFSALGVAGVKDDAVPLADEQIGGHQAEAGGRSRNEDA